MKSLRLDVKHQTMSMFPRCTLSACMKHLRTSYDGYISKDTDVLKMTHFQHAWESISFAKLHY